MKYHPVSVLKQFLMGSVGGRTASSFLYLFLRLPTERETLTAAPEGQTRRNQEIIHVLGIKFSFYYEDSFGSVNGSLVFNIIHDFINLI